MKLNNFKKRFLKNSLILLLYLIFLTISSLSPGVPGKNGPPGVDKIFHFLSYLILGFILLKTLFSLGTAKKIWYNLLISILLCTFYGILMEFFQGFIPGRSPEAADAAANFLGSTAASFLVYFLKGSKKDEQTRKD